MKILVLGKISETHGNVFSGIHGFMAQSEKRFVLSGSILVRNSDTSREETKMY